VFLLRFVIKLEVNIYGCHGYASKLRNNFKVQVIFEVVLCLKFAFSSKFDFNNKLGFRFNGKFILKFKINV